MSPTGKPVAGRNRRVDLEVWRAKLATLGSGVVVYGILGAFAVLTVGFIVWCISMSLMTNAEMFGGRTFLPAVPQWDNYVRAWTRGHLGLYLKNSIFVSVGGVLLIDLLASTAAYVLARFNFPLSRLSLMVIVSGMAIPVEMIVVPLIIIFKSAGLSGSLSALTLVYVAISLPFSVFVMVGFFRTLPSELEDAAALDGASEWSIFWRVMLPLAAPGLFTISIINFVDIWNECLIALMLMRDDARMTVSVGLYALKGGPHTALDWTSVFAAAIMVMIPTIVVFLLLEDRIEGGLKVGALKG